MITKIKKNNKNKNMNQTQKALENYTKAKQVVLDHIEANQAVFKSHEALVSRVIDAEEALRDAAYLEKTPVQNDFAKVNYVPVFKKYYDGGLIMSKVTPAQKKVLIDSGVLTYEIDRDGFDKLVAEGKLPIQLKQEAYREQEKNPRVTISQIHINKI